MMSLFSARQQRNAIPPGRLMSMMAAKVSYPGLKACCMNR
ncbi:hypothetical protein BU813_26690 [Klebsiella pneumoniae subsp. pneumoniae]|nr:hypothetical protein ABY63_09995 [Klebsiella pneumoniae]AUX49429.1 hypothetical protein BU195_01350 [Klebsiella pneumoniae subsp. pneumoniae]EPA89574.1 hypothetical protein H237_0348 [Klebsiella pneumoniae UHKPC57]EPO92468.1 hypothetical protein H238_0326 [Klebsiella pneumoniae UHKPC179]ANK15948.1 hypothetical protein A9J37_08365 [Klebsiella pneumoniae]